jgi:fermentation-respiration switch protein FrsA (DUF1100 family)
MPKGKLKPMLRLVAIPVVFFVVASTLLMIFESRLIYFPSVHPAGSYELPTSHLPGWHYPAIEDVWLTAADGTRIHGWFCRPMRSEHAGAVRIDTDMTLLWFHGNAGSILERYEIVRIFMELPIDVFVIDYRGYGQSAGKPSEQGLYMDAKAAWSYLTGDRAIAPDRIVIFGKSLGGGPATELATHVNAGGLILQSAFTSIPDMAGVCFPIFPRFIVRTQMNSLSKIGEISCPKLIIHSPVDEVIPYQMGRELFEAAEEPKTFYTVEDAGHNETFLIGGKEYVSAVRDFLESCRQ